MRKPKQPTKQIAITADEDLVNRFKNFCNVHRLKYKEVFEKVLVDHMDTVEGKKPLASKKFITTPRNQAIDALLKQQPDVDKP